MRFYVVLAVAVSSVFASPLAISSNLDSRGTANLAGTIGFGACLGGPDCCGIDDFNFCFCAASDQAMGNCRLSQAITAQDGCACLNGSLQNSGFGPGVL